MVNGVTWVSPVLSVVVAPGGSLITVTCSVVPWNINAQEQIPTVASASTITPILFIKAPRQIVISAQSQSAR